MNNKSIEVEAVLRLALEALEKADPLCPVNSDAEIFVRAAHDAIKEALSSPNGESQPAVSETHKQEPVAWLNRDSVDGLWYPNAFKTDNLEPSIPLYTHPHNQKKDDSPKDEAFRMEHALRLALEALKIEDLACRYCDESTPEHIAKAITAIEQALEKRK